MRKIMFLLVILLALPDTLWAADPIIGTWKTNLEKSAASDGEKKIKEEICIYREIEGGLVELDASTVYEDGTAESSKWAWPKEGEVAKCVTKTLPEEMLYVEVLVGPGHWFASITMDKKQIGLYHKEVSKDKKTMNQVYTGLDDNGKPITIKKVLERQ